MKETRLKRSITEAKKGRTGHCVLQQLGREVSGMQQKSRSRLGTQRGHIRSGFKDEKEAAGSESDARRQKWDVRFSIAKKTA